jgi:hypothetical protein
MASTTNYSWSTPDNSGLVKNGAQDIRTLGSAIDTSVWNVGYGQAGKNKIINGDCSINQRNFSSGTATGQYVVDRFQDDGTGGTITTSVQQFTPGAAPVAGYEAKQFMRTITATQSAAGHYQSFSQAIEDVRTFAGQTVTISFWAKAASGTPNIGASISQVFGSGGSSSVITSAAVKTITTSWARYSFTITMPSITGKTIGTSSYLKLYIMVSVGTTISGLGYPAVGLQNNTFDVWGIQVEAGSTATPFQTATGTLQGELAACQRYYWRSSDTNAFANYGVGYADQTNSLYASVKLPVSMRVKPTSVDYSTLSAHIYNVSATSLSAVTLESSSLSRDWGVVVGTATGLTQFRPYGLNNNNSTSGYIGFSAEL